MGNFDNWDPEKHKIYLAAMERAKKNNTVNYSDEELAAYGISPEGVQAQRVTDHNFADAETPEEKRRALLLAAAADDLATAKKLREEHNRERGEIIARQNNTGCWTKITDAFFGR